MTRFRSTATQRRVYSCSCLRRGGDEKPLFDYRSLRRDQSGITKEHEDNSRIDHGVNRSNMSYFHGSGPISNRDRQMECADYVR